MSNLSTSTPESQPQADGPQDEPILRPALGPQWALGLPHLVLVTVLGLLFLLANYIPLRATDLWGHVIYGRWMLSHMALPQTDPMLPLAAGMRVVDNAWLSQVLFALVEQYAGAGGLSSLFAVTTLLGYVILARVFFLQSRRVGVAIIGVAIVLTVGWSRLWTIRPENLTVVLFATLLWLIASALRRTGDDPAGLDYDAWRPARLWLGVPLVMALWANLHGSYFVGVAVLACYFLGSLVDRLWQTRSLPAVLGDRIVRRWLWLTELAALATLINPYGLDLWIETVRFSSNPSLQGILEWQPLVFINVGGREFAASLLLLVVVLRHSRRRMPAAHVLLLVLFALAAMWRIRMLGWYAMVLAFVLAPHLGELLARFWPAAQPATETVGPAVGDGYPPLPPSGRSFRYTLVSVLVAWVCFALSDTSRPLLGGKPRTTDQLLGSETPRGLTEYLRANPPAGPIFNPQHWGDWLVWDGPQGLVPMMTTNVHLVPSSVWSDYVRVDQVQPGWQRVLDRYGIDTVLVDKKVEPALEQVMRRETDWTAAYEDDLAVVFTRNPRQSATPQAAPAENADPLTRFDADRRRRALRGI